jgi:4-methylaminobutanoate oxidase (formaldehyde-forming)
LNFAIAKTKNFVGKDALMNHVPRKKLVTLILEDPRSIVLSNEPVSIHGKIVGRVTSGSYGVAVESSIAFAYLPLELTTEGTEAEVLVFGNWIKAIIKKSPLYDPKGEKVKT